MRLLHDLLPLVLLVSVSGCGYQVISEAPANPQAITQASVFHARELTVSFDHSGWDVTPEKWEEHVGYWKQAYAEEVRGAPGGKTVNLTGPGETPGDGIVIEADLPRLEKSYSMTSGSGNFATLEMTFTDAKGGDVLYKARIRAAGAGSFGAFAPQIKNAIGTCVGGIHRVMSKGTVK